MKTSWQWADRNGAIASDLAVALETPTRVRIVNAAVSSPRRRAPSRPWTCRAPRRPVYELVADQTSVASSTSHAAPVPLGAPLLVAAGKARACEKRSRWRPPWAARVIERRAPASSFYEAFMYRCHPLVALLVLRLARRRPSARPATCARGSAFSRSRESCVPPLQPLALCLAAPSSTSAAIRRPSLASVAGIAAGLPFAAH